MARGTRNYQLTQQLIARHAAGQVLCLAARAEGRTFQLHTDRPSSELNEIVAGAPAQLAAPAVVRVDIRGVIEQRAGYHDYCGGWSDGHDAIAERMCDALELGDVVMVVDSPGGAHHGLEDAVARVQEAKTEHGRRVYAFADEMIGSAAYWWCAAVADEIYVPRSGVVGSIGARALHESFAGALAEAGVVPTYFAWPGDGKIAFAPELPLSETARARAERDIAACGEAFAAAVEEGRGLTRDAIVALNADCLMGEAAVDAGLADGTARIEDVIEHALAVASGAESSMSIKKSASETYEKTTKERYESDDEPAPEAEGEGEGEDADESEEADEEPEASAEDEPMPEEEGDEPKPKAAARAPRVGASLAEIVGLRRGASQLAIKNAALRMRTTLDAVKATLEVDGDDELVGATKAVAQDAALLASVEAEKKGLEREQRAARRMTAAKKHAALVGAGEVFQITTDAEGKKRKAKLLPEWQSMKLEAYEAMVARKAKTTSPRARTTPFDIDRAGVQASAKGQGNLEAAIEAAKSKPAVIASARRTGQPIEKFARAYVASFPQEFAAAGDPSF